MPRGNSISRSKNAAVVLRCRRAGCCSARETASARSLRRRARRGRRGPPPASAAGTCARRRGNRPGRDRRRPRSRRPASRAGKSCPLAIICVPTSMSISPAREPSRAASARLPLRRHRVAIDAADARVREQRPRAAASTRSVPKPMCSRYGAAHLRALLRHDHASSCSSGSARATPSPCAPCAR